MASWKRFFNTPNPRYTSTTNSLNTAMAIDRSNYSSNLRDVYTGPSNRIDKYNQYDQLDRDPVVKSALDIIAEFCTQENGFTNLPFWIKFIEESSEGETTVLNDALAKWSYTNSFRKRMFYIWRNTLKYGDTFFVRDPETYELHYVDPRNVEKIIVDDNKKIHSYFIRNVSPNLAQKILTQNTKAMSDGLYNTSNITQLNVNATMSTKSNAYGPSMEILAGNVVHLSLNSTGLDYINWPFSGSLLDSIYKPAKQKELLEDAYLIYKIQRAPDRRVFYIYTGDLPSHKAMAFVERIKNDFHQKRLPSRNGGAGSIVDATYDPNSINDDLFFPVNAEGQGPRVEQLPGGGDLSSGDGDLLDYFNNAVITGLGIPISYIPTIARDSQQPYNDGKTGVALLQEWRFAKMCERIQGLLREEFDFEFKLYCKKRDISIMASDFSLEFEEPQSFSEYRQMEKDQTMFSILSQADSVSYISKRFALKRFGQFTEDEIVENERLWKEENKGKVVGTVADIELNDHQDISLNNVGVKKMISDEDEEDLEVEENEIESAI